jgi:hypothetical protein
MNSPLQALRVLLNIKHQHKMLIFLLFKTPHPLPRRNSTGYAYIQNPEKIEIFSWCITVPSMVHYILKLQDISMETKINAIG